MRLFAVDMETYWHPSEYSLAKMTIEEYIRDPRFELQVTSLYDPLDEFTETVCGLDESRRQLLL